MRVMDKPKKETDYMGKYRFIIVEYDGFSILRLDQVPLIGMQGYVPIKLNPFLVSKINAEIIPFSEYGI